MKIREGFVSNSSSTSFCIYGARFPYNKRQELEAKEGNGIELFHGDPNYGENCYLGIDFVAMGDDETKNQFKARIEKALKEAFPGEDLDIGIWEESYYDG